MNPVIQISDGKSSGSSAKSSGRSVVAHAGKKEFDILLAMLGSAVKGTSTTASDPKTGKGDAATGKGSDAKSSAGDGGKKTVSFSRVEEQLLAAMLSGKQPAKHHGSSSVKSESASKQAAAGLPIVIQDQAAGKSASKSASPSSTGNATAKEASAMLAGSEPDIISAMKADNAASGSEQKAKPAGTHDKGETGTVSAKTASTGKSAVETDLLKLMTAAPSGRADRKTVKELNGLLAKIDAGKSGSEKGHAPKTRTGSEVAPLREDGSASQSSRTGSGSNESRQRVALKEDSSASITGASKSSARSTAVDPAKQADAVAASAGQSGNSGSSQTISGSQANNGSSQAVPKQNVQVQPGRFDQNGGSSNDSGRNQADMSKPSPIQNYTFAANNTAPNSSFTQALSATQQSFQGTPTTPNLQQLAQGIVKQVSMMTLQGKKVVNVKLQPESLGSLTLQVVSDGGKISAQFNVRTADARAFLESSAPQMKQMLETNGVTLAHLNVSLSGGEFQSGNPRQEYKPGRQHVKYYNDSTGTVTPAVSTEISRSFGYNTMEMQV